MGDAARKLSDCIHLWVTQLLLGQGVCSVISRPKP